MTTSFKVLAAFARLLTSLSQVILSLEKLLSGILIAMLLTLILVNVATRMMRLPIYWIDELSIFAMVWLGFIGASVMIRLRIDFAVTLVLDKLAEPWLAWMRAFGSALSLSFALVLVLICWAWLDPIGIASHGFDARSFAADSFNFLYTERTQTLEWPTWVVTLIIPIFALTLVVHTSANLVEDLGLTPQRQQDVMATAEETN